MQIPHLNTPKQTSHYQSMHQQNTNFSKSSTKYNTLPYLPETTKQLLIDQIDFYFADQNLAYDHFFQSKISKHPQGWIKIKYLLRCNKIHKILKENHIPREHRIFTLVQAINESRILELDRSKKMLRRQIMFDKDKAISRSEDATLYVEGLPKEITHELLKKVFGKCGNIVNIKIPYFHKSKRVKGFAFVEYDSPDQAVVAVKHFQNMIPHEFIFLRFSKVKNLRVLLKKEWLNWRKELKKMGLQQISKSSDEKQSLILMLELKMKCDVLNCLRHKCKIEYAYLHNYQEEEQIFYVTIGREDELMLTQSVDFVKEYLQAETARFQVLGSQETEAYLKEVQTLKERAKSQRQSG